MVLPNTAASIMHPLLKMAAQRRIRVIEAPFKWPLLEKTEEILPFDSEVEEQAEEGSSGTLDLSSTSSSAAAIITASIESCITASTTAVLVEHVHGLTGAEMPLYEIGNNVLNMSICGNNVLNLSIHGIGQLCRRHGVNFIVEGSYALGAVSVDLSTSNDDSIAGGGLGYLIHFYTGNPLPFSSSNISISSNIDLLHFYTAECHRWLSTHIDGPPLGGG